MSHNVPHMTNFISRIARIFLFIFYFIECFTTTFLRAHSWLNWVNEDDDEVGLKEKQEDTRYKDKGLN